MYVGCQGPPGIPWVGYPSSPLRSQKRPRNLGEPAPMLIAKACLDLQEGGVGAVPNGTGTGSYNGENAQNLTPIPGGLPSAPWQMSVRVAPSTMNWGFDISSYKTHGHVPGPVPPRNWYPDTTNNGGPSPIATTIRTKFYPEWPSYRRSLPFDAIGFRGMGTQFLEAQAMRNRREGLVLEEDSTLQASRPQIFIILAQVLDGVFMAAQTQLLVPLLLHLG